MSHELNLNVDNIVAATLANGLEVMGKDVTPADSTDLHLEDALYVSLTFNGLNEQGGQRVTPKFDPLTLLADTDDKISDAMDVVFPRGLVLTKFKPNKDLIPLYKARVSPIVV
jgi:hypothetical protein